MAALSGVGERGGGEVATYDDIPLIYDLSCYLVCFNCAPCMPFLSIFLLYPLFDTYFV